MSESALAKKVVATLVTEVPGVEVPGPSVHLFCAQIRGIVYHGRKNTGLMDSGRPEALRERVILTHSFCDLPQAGNGNTIRMIGIDPEPCHPFDCRRIRKRFQFLEDFIMWHSNTMRAFVQSRQRPAPGDGLAHNGAPERLPIETPTSGSGVGVSSSAAFYGVRRKS